MRKGNMYHQRSKSLNLEGSGTFCEDQGFFPAADEHLSRPMKIDISKLRKQQTSFVKEPC